jgi:hypothetical protein
MAIGNWHLLKDIYGRAVLEDLMTGPFVHAALLTPLSLLPEPPIRTKVPAGLWDNPRTLAGSWESKVVLVPEPEPKPAKAPPWPPKRELDFEE